MPPKKSKSRKPTKSGKIFDTYSATLSTGLGALLLQMNMWDEERKEIVEEVGSSYRTIRTLVGDGMATYANELQKIRSIWHDRQQKYNVSIYPSKIRGQTLPFYTPGQTLPFTSEYSLNNKALEVQFRKSVRNKTEGLTLKDGSTFHLAVLMQERLVLRIPEFIWHGGEYGPFEDGHVYREHLRHVPRLMGKYVETYLEMLHKDENKAYIINPSLNVKLHVATATRNAKLGDPDTIIQPFNTTDFDLRLNTKTMDIQHTYTHEFLHKCMSAVTHTTFLTDELCNGPSNYPDCSPGDVFARGFFISSLEYIINRIRVILSLDDPNNISKSTRKYVYSGDFQPLIQQIQQQIHTEVDIQVKLKMRNITTDDVTKFCRVMSMCYDILELVSVVGPYREVYYTSDHHNDWPQIQLSIQQVVVALYYGFGRNYYRGRTAGRLEFDFAVLVVFDFILYKYGTEAEDRSGSTMGFESVVIDLCKFRHSLMTTMVADFPWGPQQLATACITYTMLRKHADIQDIEAYPADRYICFNPELLCDLRSHTHQPEEKTISIFTGIHELLDDTRSEGGVVDWYHKKTKTLTDADKQKFPSVYQRDVKCIPIPHSSVHIMTAANCMDYSKKPFDLAIELYRYDAYARCISLSDIDTQVAGAMGIWDNERFCRYVCSYMTNDIPRDEAGAMYLFGASFDKNVDLILAGNKPCHLFQGINLSLYERITLTKPLDKISYVAHRMKSRVKQLYIATIRQTSVAEAQGCGQP